MNRPGKFALHVTPDNALPLPGGISTMVGGHDEGGEDLYVSIPLGGPIYVPDMVGPLTRVSDFENSVFQELQGLREELSGDSLGIFDEEILVDELKIIGEEELVTRAFEEAFKDDELSIDASQLNENLMSPRKAEDKIAFAPELGGSGRKEGDTGSIIPNEYPLPVKTYNKNPNQKSSRKRKEKKNDHFDDSYMEKVKQLSKMIQKQEEDKTAVRLHSFNGCSSVAGCGACPKRDKIISLRSASVREKVRASKTCVDLPVHFPEAVICFEVYHNRKQWLKTQEFLVLGRQFLTEIKDKIHCATDEMMKKAGMHNPSGYFLIEDSFYNDMRNPLATDYSEPILDWLENSKNEAIEKWDDIVSGELQQKQKALLSSNKKTELPKFRSFQMQTTRFCDLRFSLGAGYLYCHQGDCKHIIVLRDMRLIHPEDVQNRAAYPVETLRAKYRRRKCSVCNIYAAQKVTVDDKWAPENPCYFCEVCYYMLHYANGSLLYSEFSVHDFHQGFKPQNDYHQG